MKLLAIGNSFSQDATYYLHQLAQADGTDLFVANLYISGCSLERHWKNVIEKLPDYLLEINGTSTDKYVTIQEALAMENWDYISVQQSSKNSGLEETYHPFLENLVYYLKNEKPEAKLLMHQTWAYEIDFMNKIFDPYDHDQNTMYECLNNCYKKNAKALGLLLLPCGDVIQALRKKKPFLYNQGGMSICRDGYHMNILYGRYLLAAVWYCTIMGRSASGISFIPHSDYAPHVECNMEILHIVQETIDEYKT